MCPYHPAPRGPGFFLQARKVAPGSRSGAAEPCHPSRRAVPNGPPGFGSPAAAAPRHTLNIALVNGLAVKRNIDRFPSDFMFQLTRNEASSNRAACATPRPTPQADRTGMRRERGRRRYRHMPRTRGRRHTAEPRTLSALLDRSHRARLRTRRGGRAAWPLAAPVRGRRAHDLRHALRTSHRGSTDGHTRLARGGRVHPSVATRKERHTSTSHVPAIGSPSHPYGLPNPRLARCPPGRLISCLTIPHPRRRLGRSRRGTSESRRPAEPRDRGSSNVRRLAAAAARLR
jgi:ORF6N domain